MEFNLEELKLINYAFYVMKNEMTLGTDELLVARKIAETLEHWGIEHYKI